MTYRDRREARADRLRGWADGRDRKAETAAETFDRISGMIPFGQPILVGHHSEGRHRRDIARMHSAMDASVENTRTAERMRSTADNIDAAAEHAIYSDDPDAIERLRARLEELELERDQVKAENAAFRQAHRLELKGMTAWERDQAMPHRAYVLQNLTGNITRQRQRLAGLERDQARPLASVKHGRKGAYVKCPGPDCSFPFVVGMSYDDARALADAHNAEVHG